MVEYKRRYKFEKKPVTPIPATEDVTEIIDERVKILVETKEIIRRYTFEPRANIVFSIPLIYDDQIKGFKIGKYARTEAVAYGHFFPSEPSPLQVEGDYQVRIMEDYGWLTRARLEVYDGSNWIKLKSTSDGEPIIVPKSQLFDLGTFTATGTGDTIDTVIGYDKWTWQVISNSSGTAHNVELQGSIDGTNWFVLDTSNTTGSEMRHVVNKPVRYIRANVIDMGDATEISVKVFGMR